MLEKNKIKSMRILIGIKQKDMAKKLGVSPQYLSRLESGKIDLKISTLKQIADILGISVSKLID
ncbi:MAG: helix-turn-helix transcriptional regulator [Romboutsia sp.]